MDEKKFEDLIYKTMTRFYQKVIAPKMATKEDLADLKSGMDEKMEGMEERLGKRIDKVAETVTDTRTNHERRIRRLEEEVGVEPEARLI